MTESLLIDCPACGNRVSREAVAFLSGLDDRVGRGRCPRCGHPIAERQTGSAEPSLPVSEHDVSPPPLLPAWLWVALGVLVVGVVAVEAMSDGPDRGVAVTSKEPEPTTTTTIAREPVVIEDQGEAIRPPTTPALTEDGIGLARLGGGAGYTLRMLEEYLGRPSTDTGYREPDWLRCYFVEAERVVSWGVRGFVAVFASGGERFGGPGARFVYYVQSDSGLLLTTDLGLKPGDHYRDLREAYGDVEIIDYPFSENGYVELAAGYGQGLNAWLADNYEVESITAGAMCGE